MLVVGRRHGCLDAVDEGRHLQRLCSHDGRAVVEQLSRIFGLDPLDRR